MRDNNEKFLIIWITIAENKLTLRKCIFTEL